MGLRSSGDFEKKKEIISGSHSTILFSQVMKRKQLREKRKSQFLGILVSGFSKYKGKIKKKYPQGFGFFVL